jgi:hypothetical protein
MQLLNIDPHYLEDPQDLETIMAGLRYSKAMTDTTSFKDSGLKPLPAPLCKDHTTWSREYYKLQMCGTGYASYTLPRILYQLAKWDHLKTQWQYWILNFK